ncbi:RDD family protein [Saccharothrix sp. BKS2]|uniref:RDD family protein n=1 Tax=Saccharothrix sp. BKS2 TaxID=3064400 RepID=UPI0039EB40AC
MARFRAGAGLALRRLAQYGLDTLLVVVAALSVTIFSLAAVVLLAGVVRLPPQALFVPLGALVVTSLLGTLWVDVWCPHRHGGTTPAMRWLGLRITTLRGGPPTLRAYLLRWLLLQVDTLFLGLVGVVLILVTPRHQRLGDLVARTVVVRARKAAEDAEAAEVTEGEAAEDRTPADRTPAGEVT